MRRWVRGTLAVLVIAALVCGGVLASVPPAAEARSATGGVGRFGDAIDWIEWGAVNQTLPNGGFTGTTTRVIGGQTLQVQCTTSNLSSTQADQSAPFLRAYRSGSYVGDALDDMYNIGGTGGANQMVAGLSNVVVQAGLEISFDVGCTATWGGAPVPLAGLVYADAEQSSSVEYIEATPATLSTWRIIDRYRTPGCTNSNVATRNAANTLRITGGSLCGSGPAAVAFVDGATTARIALGSANGVSAVALGVVLGADRGDAPASYGDAAHLASFSFTGGAVPQDTPTQISDPAFALGSAAPPPTRLGSRLDPEDPANSSADATGDDLSGSGAFGPVDDEDALNTGTSIAGEVGDAYSAAVNCSNGSSAAGWIDWNIDGDFLDIGERSQTATCAGGSASLNWTIPSAVIGKLAGSQTFLRVRLAQSAAQIAAPASFATSGEAEDYRVTLDIGTSIELTKSLPTRARPDDQFTVTIADDAPVASAATVGSGTSAGTGRIIVAPGTAYTVGEAITTGVSTLADYGTVTIACANPVTGTAILPTGSIPTWTLPALTDGERIACTITNIGNQPAISLEKSTSGIADIDGNGPDAGDSVGYSFRITNTGNAPLSDISVSETAFSGSAGDPVVSCPPTAEALAPGVSVTCTATYRLTQADIDSGQLSNTATATGTPPGTLLPPVSAPDTVAIPIARSAEISLVKSATPNAAASFTVGQLIQYSFLITNTGTTTLENVTVAETAFSGAGPAPTPVCPAAAASLAPGAQVICTADYTLTQDDVDAGSVSNSARATGTPPPGLVAPTAESEAVIPVDPAPALSISKSVAPSTGAAAGEQVVYSFAMTNTGNVTLQNAVPVEGAFSGAGVLGPIECPVEAATMIPGATVTCTAAYILVQQDVDAGQVTNTASATATSPGGDAVLAALDDAVLTPAAASAISIQKSATPTTAGAAGDVVTYAFLVTNTGSVTLTDIAVVEAAFSGTGTAPVAVCPPGAMSLAPGDTVTCSATYALTQQDVDAGIVTNSATASGDAPAGQPDPTSEPSDASVTIAGSPALTLRKTATPTEGRNAGDAITYAFVVENTGNVSLSGIAVQETAFSGADGIPDIVCPVVPIAPGGEVTCTATYLLTQADVDAGEVTNTATASGLPPRSLPAVLSLPSDASVMIPSAPALTLTKTASSVDDKAAGDSVTYTFVVRNVGNVSLSAISVTETDFSGSGPSPAVVCPPVDALAPTEELACHAEYTLTEEDEEVGTVTNRAAASARPPAGAPVMGMDEVAVMVAADPPVLPGEIASTGTTGAAVLVFMAFAAIAIGATLLGPRRSQQSRVR